MDSPIPKRCDVAVIGGGPSGSSTATLLAKEGLEVVLLEKVRHPRPQVGESVIPHMWKLAERLGVAEKILAEGFLAKAGGIIVWDGHANAVRFSDFGYSSARPGLHVERDRFDRILLDHSGAVGAQVFEEVIVRRVDFSGVYPALIYDGRRGGGRLECRWVVDASGPSAVVARQLGSRRLVESDRKFLGLWGYFACSRFFGPDGRGRPPESLSEVRPVTFVTSYRDGWIWHIILRDVTSVGFVMDTGDTRGMNRAQQEAYFRKTCSEVPYLSELLAPATFVEGSMSFRPDYSYYSAHVAGDGFFCVGDAAAFVDPILSQGVIAGMFHASLAAWAITSTIRRPRRERFYTEVFRSKVLQYYGYTRLLAFGDFGGEGIEPALVTQLVKSLPRNELELSFAGSWATGRHQNLLRIIHDAGLDGGFLTAKVHALEKLEP